MGLVEKSSQCLTGGQPVVTTITSVCCQLPPRMKCVLSALLGALCAAVALFSVGCVAPFPEGDPRAVLNPVIVPWWRVSPRPVRSFLHELVVGSPLPPNDLQQLDQMLREQRARRPRPAMRLRTPIELLQRRP